MAQIDYDQQINLIWGGGSYDSYGLLPLVVAASNVRVGPNPPYTAADFLRIYPNFGGVPVTGNVTLIAGQAAFGFSTPNNAALPVGSVVTGAGVPNTATVASYANAVLTLSDPPTISGTPVAINIYAAPFVPTVVLNLFIAAARGSIFIDRWCELWELAMGLYVAHYVTLWLKANGNPATTPGRLVSAALAFGILTSKAADGVSAGYSVLSGLDDWGAYQLTEYGQQFATFAKVIGSGSALVH